MDLIHAPICCRTTTGRIRRSRAAGGMLRWLSVWPSFLLAACIGRPMPDAYVPPFAKVPFESFSRAAVVAIALREWRLFGQRMADPEAEPNRTVKPEREQGLW